MCAHVSLLHICRGYKILKPTFHLTIKVETNSA